MLATQFPSFVNIHIPAIRVLHITGNTFSSAHKLIYRFNIALVDIYKLLYMMNKIIGLYYDAIRSHAKFPDMQQALSVDRLQRHTTDSVLAM